MILKRKNYALIMAAKKAVSKVKNALPPMKTMKRRLGEGIKDVATKTGSAVKGLFK